MNRILAYAPLVPFAVAASVGLVLDRMFVCSVEAGLLLALAGTGGWVAFLRRTPVAMLGLWVALVGLALAYHHAWRHQFSADDVGEFAGYEPRLVALRGIIAEEPMTRRFPDDPLLTQPRPEVTAAIVQVSEVRVASAWQPVSGRVRLTTDARLDAFRVGDECEFTGWLARPLPPQNLGEWDYASHLRDQRIRADIRVRQATDNIVRLREGDVSLTRLLASLRGWSQRGLAQHLEGDEQAVASALLLGDTTALTTDEWERYIRTGVIHVLAISGQHLVVLGAFLWFVLRLFGVPRRSSAVTVAVVLVAYALLTGGRPSAMRAAVMACALCGGILLRRQASPANTMALAWLVVLGVNPTDLFTSGFQLSFLCVAVLVWGIPAWFPGRELSPLEQLIDESRPMPHRILRQLLKFIGRAYLVTMVLSLATAPLIMYWQSLVSPAGLVIGPLAILLTTIGLIAGFLLLLTWPVALFSNLFAWITTQALAWCEWVVRTAERMPMGCWYVGQPPLWWLVGFYTIGIAWMARLRWIHLGLTARPRESLFFALALGAWTLLGIGHGLRPRASDELRVTFLAVDHGACVVLEIPDGRVFLYDVGANAGPDVTKRHVAPYLWHRGVRHLDEVFLSHADLDHFNGLPPLLDRFTVGRITYSPTFADKPSAGVRKVLQAIDTRNIPVQIAQRGDYFAAGNVELIVVHPSTEYIAGEENARSMVILVRHEGHTILLTGDLDNAGLRDVLTLPPISSDVLMTPHHGSVGLFPAEIDRLATWAKPRLVVSCQGRHDAAKAEAIYQRHRIPYWGTYPHGMITLRSHRTGLIAETISGERTVVRTGR